MRRIVFTAVCLGLLSAQAFAGSTVSSGASASTTTNASSHLGGTAIVTSFGLAGSLISVGPGSAITTATQTTQTSGVALGNASFSGSARASAHSFGYSSWQTP
jgi:hypothetical protein